MPDISPTEKLQPCLLDRLTDNEPELKVESRTARVMSPKRYREAVLRDLQWLLNSNAHLPEEGIEDFAEVAKSVLNFGARDLSGLIASSLRIEDLERQLASAIERFEPRIIRNTLKVKGITETETSGPNKLSFEIRGDLWALPMSEQLYIKTEIDLDTGECRLGS